MELQQTEVIRPLNPDAILQGEDFILVVHGMEDKPRAVKGFAHYFKANLEMAKLAARAHEYGRGETFAVLDLPDINWIKRSEVA